MATYTISLDERTASGKALIAYLQSLDVVLSVVPSRAKSSFQSSQEDIKAGRVETFSSSAEMFKSLGIWRMYTIKVTKTFRKDTERCRKRGYDMELLKNAIQILEQNGTLPPSYRAHKLSGQFDNCWECHLKGDWLLLWQQNDTDLTLLFTGTGTHSDIFWHPDATKSTDNHIFPYEKCARNHIFP